MSKDSPRDEFLRRMEAGEAIQNELLQALAEQLRRTPRTTDRNQLVRAAVRLLMRRGRTKSYAIERAFAVYGGPQDERERRRIVNEGACKVLATLTYPEVGIVELFWSDDPAAVTRLAVGLADGRLVMRGDLGAQYWAQFDLNELDPPGGYRRPAAEEPDWKLLGTAELRMEYPDKQIKPPSKKSR